MDHGPMIAQEEIELTGNEFIQDLEKDLANMGAGLIIKILPDFISGKISLKEQDHVKATCVKKITKSDGEINLTDEPVKNWQKFRAYFGWPRTYFFKDGKRIIITKAKLEDERFIIEKIIPEGGKEQDYKI